jgi:DNA primase large subunit
MALEDLRKNEMMAHLLDSLDKGQDIGHYGRLTFVMVARFFASDNEIVEQLTKDKDCDEQKARLLIKQVEAKSYNPPKRERILEWMNQQDFPICQDPENPGACNVYKSLEFPAETYEKISSYYQQDGTA